jgi:FMN phosphatase YigB (HAD superfamily)
MSALPEVKALVFDVFGTVVDWRNGIARDARTFLARHGRSATNLPWKKCAAAAAPSRG